MKHKKITFVPGTLGRFIRKHQIHFEYLEVHPEMICRKRHHEGEKFFILTLYRPGGKILKIPYSQGVGVRHWPRIEDTLEMIAADSMMYLSNPTFEDFVQAFGLEDDEADSLQTYEVIKSVAERTKAFLGDEAFDELIDMEIKGYEMEGDRIWPKRTCG